MRIADFERAMPSNICIDAFKCVLGEVVACIAHIGKTRLVFDTNGKAFEVVQGIPPEGYINYYDEDLSCYVTLKTNRPMPTFDLQF